MLSFTEAHRSKLAMPRGFTLIEVMTVCLVLAVLAALALPALNTHLKRGKRSDAISAMTRLQQAQDNYLYQNGRYADDLNLIGLADRSPQGLYRLQITRVDSQGYAATATALPDSGQTKDGQCSILMLTISPSGAEYGPVASCWNR